MVPRAPFRAIPLLLVLFAVCSGTLSAADSRLTELRGTVERAIGPAGLLELRGRQPVTVRALIAWGRLPVELNDTLLGMKSTGIDLLPADAAEVRAQAERLDAAGDTANAGPLRRLAELLTSHDYLDWEPLADDAGVHPGELLRIAADSGGWLRWGDGSELRLGPESLVEVPEAGGPPPPGIDAAAPTDTEVSAECAAARALIDSPEPPLPERQRHWIGPLSLELPVGWVPLPEPDREAYGGFSIGGADQGWMVNVGLMVAPAPEAEMIKQITRGGDANLVGPEPVTVAGKPANRYRITGTPEGKPVEMRFYFISEPRPDGKQLVLIAGGGGDPPAGLAATLDPILAGATLGEPAYRLVRRIGGEGETLGRFKYPEGVASDAKGRLFVLDAHNHRVQVFDTDGSQLGAWGERGQEPRHLSRPLDIAIDPDGNVLVLDPRDVKRFTPDGTFLGLWPSDEAPYRFDELFDTAMSLDRDGRLLALDGGQVKQIGTDGQLLATHPGITDRAVADPRGNLLWTERDNHRIRRNDPAGNPVWNWSLVGRTATAPAEKEIDGFTPESVAVDLDGNLYVGDNDGVIRKYDPSGRFLVQWGPILDDETPDVGQPRPRMGNITELAVAPSGVVYASDRYADTVLVFEPSPEHRPRCAPAP